ncbi:MAG: hypothetical protein ABEN55_00675 [Bradymonadaceae bacterium]
MTDVPTYLPASPDLWLDASQEPVPPADGSGDERPTNLAPRSDVEVEQATGSNQPTWDESELAWQFDGTQFWSVSDSYNVGAHGLTWVVVAKCTDSTLGFGRHFYRGTTGSTSPRIDLNFNPNGSDTRCYVEDESGTSVNTQISVSDLSGAKFVNAITFDFPKGSVEHRYLSANDDVRESQNVGTLSAFTTSDLFVGQQPDYNGFIGPKYEIIELPVALSLSDFDMLIDNLAAKHGIL